MKNLFINLVVILLLSSCNEEKDECLVASCGETPSPSAPSRPTVSSPAQNPFYSNLSSLTISGSCETGNTVNLSGADTQQYTCQNGNFTFTINSTTDGSKNFVVTQTNSSGVASDSKSLVWVRDTSAPTAPAITTPSSSPYYFAQSSFTLTVSCETGNTVTLSGSQSLSKSCTNGSANFTISKSIDGTYDYTLSQTDRASNTSTTTSFQWVRNSANPAPTITNPAISPFYSNLSSLTISGGCSGASTVILSGFSPATTTCSSSAYLFNRSSLVDGTYNFSVAQFSGAMSDAVTKIWIRDTIKPLAPEFYGNNPLVSGDSSLTLIGSCEEGSIVYLVSNPAVQTFCLNNFFSLAISSACTQDCNYEIKQKDKAENESPSAHFSWTKDPTMLSTPTITSPTLYTTYNNASSFTLSGTCTGTNLVILGGNVTSGEVTGASLSKTCSSGLYTFTINKSVDGTYNFSIVQADPTSLTESASVARVWVRDVVAPSALTIINPTTPSYEAGGELYISGNCEEGATVSISGDTSLTTLCTQNHFSFVVPKAADGSYNFSLTQTDKASNTSPSTPLTWLRDSTIPPAPRILNPSLSPYRFNGDVINVSGVCETGATVYLTLDDTQNVACTNKQFSFSIEKTQDDTYDFLIYQVIGNTSPNSAVSWIRDATGPVVSIAGIDEGADNISYIATLTFTAGEPVLSFECSLDEGVYFPCNSPISFDSLDNGTHTLSVRAIDYAYNQGEETTRTWTQSAGRTVALYHFDSGAVNVDSGNYSSSNNNAITTNTNTTNPGGKFSQGLGIGSTSSIIINHTESQLLLNPRMTVEAWFNTSKNLTNNDFIPIITKWGTGTNMGWEFGLKRLGSNAYLIFRGSNNGTTTQELRSTSVSITTGTWYHIAATYNKGAVTFYFNGNTVGGGSTSGSLKLDLFSTETNMRIASSNSTGIKFEGTLDEVRLSQVIRYTSSFTPATTPFKSD